MIQEKYSCLRNNFALPLAVTAFLGGIPAIVLLITENYIIGISLLLVCIYFFSLAFSWLFNLECYYEFDPDIGVVNHVIKKKGKTTTKQIATSSEIETFAVAGIHNSSRQGSWWTYHVVMVLKNGEVYHITDALGKKHHKIKNKAEELAKTMGCPCFDSVHEQALEIKKSPGHVEVSNRPWRFSDNLARPEVWCTLLFIAALIFTGITTALFLP